MLFRITHVANLPWLLANGLPCPNSNEIAPNYIAIGNQDLIGKREHHKVPHPPGGTLSDYVPFYFTPKTPMLLNIKTGYSGVTRRSNQEIAVLVSSCKAMRKHGVSMLFTDRHAYTPMAEWSSDQAALASMIDWDIINHSDFARDDNYPDKMERYQAEALAHRYVPPGALIGIGCASASVCSSLEADVRDAGLGLKVVARPKWYF